MRKIQYQNKVAIDPDIQLPAINKVTDSDMNEIKAVVNDNADDLKDLQDTTTEYVSDTDTRMNALESSMANLENDVSSFEETIQGDITDIETSIEGITDTTYTKTEVDTLLSAKATTTSLNNEISARENADTGLQRQIDAIVSSSDVVDIVGTYQDLQNYDTSKLGDNDIIKVLDDSTHNNATSYYRWHNSTWNYIGSEGPYYTKGETDTLLNGKVDKVAGKGLSQNDFTNTLKTKLDNIENNAQVNKIETIKVNNVTQTISSKSVNISVPTKTSDISNDSGYITKDVNNLTNYYKKTETYTQAETNTLLNAKENTSNKVTSLSSSSTDTQYPSAKCVYDLIGDIESALQILDTGSGV